jgi:SAM-dependent methyltransferase
MTLDPIEYNRKAWDRQVETGNQWTKPVSPEAVAAARGGDWQIVLTPSKAVPKEWLGEIQGADILCLASGGGQQAPILAAAGGQVTVFDNSPAQLAQDQSVAEREGLKITTVQGDMRDLSIFPDESFDLIVHPVSNVFSPQVKPVWEEAFRVLRPGGVLAAGIANPVIYIFDPWKMDKGELEVRYSLPYSDLESLSEEQLQQYIKEGTPLEFSHTLEDQIGGMLETGFVLTGFYEDRNPTDQSDPIDQYMDTFIAFCAVKPQFL